VSASRAGTVVAAALQRAGHHLVGVSAVSDASRARAASLVPDAPVLDPHEVAQRCDLLILAVPDDLLATLARGMADAGAVRPGTIVVHLSGAHGIEVLAPLAAVGAAPLALHPAMTFTGTAIDLDRLDGCPWAVTAPEELRPAAEALVVETGGEPEWIAADERLAYHAALCHAANHLVTLVAQSQDLLGAAGVHATRRYLGPLLSATLDNALRAGDAALTGPIARGDAQLVKAHVATIDRIDPTTARTYVAVARATAQRAAADGRLSAEAADAVLAVLTASPDGGTA
jgi:predicted short-subunit dehydrogenase-like oxidoreductase (DUF2520 family)